MPYCTNCGNANADDARFCSKCGAPLPSAEGAGDSTATISIGGAERADIAADRQLNPVDAAAVDALPAGSALLVVQRGPGAGSRFLLDKDVVTAGRHPDSDIFLDDVTVSRRHASSPARATRSPSPTSAASTAPTSTATASTPSCSRTATRSRSASTGWCSSRGTRPSEHHPMTESLS